MTPTDKSSPDYLARQYSTDANLAKRIRLHSYSKNRVSWFRWLFPLYRLKPGMKILEVGCGNGLLWRQNKDRIPAGCEITLTDRSAGMYEDHRVELEALGLKLGTMSADSLSFADQTFDLVIANHMLYHVPDLKKTLKELARVLKPGGVFAATTISRTNSGPLRRLARQFGLPTSMDTTALTDQFGLESGRKKLSKQFPLVERRRYRNTLRVPSADVVLDYLESMRKPGEPWQPDEARKFLEAKLRQEKVLIIRNLAAVFLCRQQ